VKSMGEAIFQGAGEQAVLPGGNATHGPRV
jgi:hypothetical protein